MVIGLVATLASQQGAVWFECQLRSLCAEFVSRAFVGFLLDGGWGRFVVSQVAFPFTRLLLILVFDFQS